MQYNKNKIMFFGIAAFCLLLFFILFFILTGGKATPGSKNTKTNTLKIWVINDKSENFNGLIKKFQSENKQYSKTQVLVETFTNYEEYYYALASAFSQGKGPDIFSLNNNEKQSIFLQQSIGISPDIINPNDFRKNFKAIFSDELIDTSSGNEFLLGVPVGYETLGVFFNRKYVRSLDLKTMSGLQSVIQKLSKRFRNVVPIGIGNGSTVDYSADIATQFMLLDNDINSLATASEGALRKGASAYLGFGYTDGDNAYNSKYKQLKNSNKTAVDLFASSQIMMVIGYPRLIEKIADANFSKNNLLVAPFPRYVPGEGKTLVNYNYFAINKDTKNRDAAQGFLKFLTTEEGMETYLGAFPHYFPALLSLESDSLDNKIHGDYNAVIKDFIHQDTELTSFDKGIKTFYDNKMVNILDNAQNSNGAYLQLKSSIRCKLNKLINLADFSKQCD